MKLPQITCTGCKGTGHRPVKGVLLKTLLRFNKATPELAATDLWKAQDKWSVNSVNNSLEKLRRAGLLKRRREGKHFLYSRV